MQTYRRLLLIGFSVLALGCSTVQAAPPEADPYRDAVDRLASAYIADREIVGMSVGLIDRGQRYTYHYGLTEANGSTPNNRTHYEIGSITKTMTGLMLADGVIRGSYPLEAHVSKLVPEAETLDKRVTLQRLSTHTSGLPRLPANLFPLDPTDPYAKYDEDHLFAWLAEPKMAYEPETQAIYSNLAAGLLGYALALHEDSDYASLLKKRVLEPLAMDDTGIDLTDEQLAAMAKPHRKDATPDHLWDLNVLAGAGGVRSNLNDMMKYLAAQLQPKQTPLTRAIELSHRRQHEPGSASLREGTYMGLGWLVHEGEPRLTHNGQTGGYFAEIWLNPDKQVGYIVMGNTSSLRVSHFASQLRGVLEATANKRPE